MVAGWGISIWQVEQFPREDGLSHRMASISASWLLLGTRSNPHLPRIIFFLMQPFQGEVHSSNLTCKSIKAKSFVLTGICVWVSPPLGWGSHARWRVAFIVTKTDTGQTNRLAWKFHNMFFKFLVLKRNNISFRVPDKANRSFAPGKSPSCTLLRSRPVWAQKLLWNIMKNLLRVEVSLTSLVDPTIKGRLTSRFDRSRLSLHLCAAHMVNFEQISLFKRNLIDAPAGGSFLSCKTLETQSLPILGAGNFKTCF